VDAARARSPYFRLLARDPDTLGARTRTDKDIFYNPDAGLPRAERELAAAATSRTNGCIYCASVHARFATHSRIAPPMCSACSMKARAPTGPRWNAIVAAAVALTQTPPALESSHIDALRAAGLDDAAISDALHGTAFFNWANRLMLSLGEPCIRPPEAAGHHSPSNFHQALPTTAKISNSSTHIAAPTRHQTPESHSRCRR
jgi:alkylhydroperoxidase domain protein